jgi:4'-phosphopantetheinyl transferase
MTSKPTLHPVILPVPANDTTLVGREKVKALRYHARQALALSAHFSDFRLDSVDKDENGVPLPSGGIHWSLSHKDQYVAAVTAPFPVGIDLEKFKPCSEALFQRLADTTEWQLSPVIDLEIFFRYWTAKEAVLKAVGKGLTGLSRCRVQAIVDDVHLNLTYESTPWTVAHYRIDADHIAAVTTGGYDIAWYEEAVPSREIRNPNIEFRNK